MIAALEIAPGVSVPQLGLGTARVEDAAIARTVAAAFDLGYRAVDTAAKYENEVGVGRGLATAGLPRSEFFVTTKLRGADQGRDAAKAALVASLDRLGLEFVDLYLIHWPLPRLGLFVESWAALEELRDAGLTRAIGVSNFLPEHLDALQAAGLPTPAVNQIELHPYLQQHRSRADNARRGIVTEAWSPLGHGTKLLREPALQAVADSVGATPAQVVLAWQLQRGIVTIPKASGRERLAENLRAAELQLGERDLATVEELEKGLRVSGQDPATHEEF